MRAVHRPLEIPAPVASLVVTDESHLTDPLASTYVRGPARFAKLVDEQVVIDVEGEGRPGERALVPRTSAAVKLLTSPSGPSFERLLRGMLAPLDAAAGAAAIRGFAFSTSLAGDAAVRAVSLAEEGLLPPLDDPSAAESLGTWLLYAIGRPGEPSDVIDGTAVTFGRIHFNAAYSDMLRQMAATPDAPTFKVWGVELDAAYHRARALDLIGHELQHTVSPVSLHDGIPAGYWLEEASAGGLATWRGARERLAASLGWDVPIDYGQSPVGYHAAVVALRRLLGLAGLDVLDEGDLRAATTLLQDRELDDVPAALAEAMGERHGLDEQRRASIALAIRDLVDWDGARGDELLDPPEIAPRLAAIERMVAGG